MIEEQRKMDEERQKLKKEQEKRIKEEQKKILGKNNSRPKLSFSLKPLWYVKICKSVETAAKQCEYSQIKDNFLL